MAAVDQEQIDLRTVLERLRRRSIFVVLTIAALLGLALFFVNVRAEQYESTATVLLAPSAAEEALQGAAQNTNFLARELANELSIAESDGVTVRLFERLADEGFDEFLENEDQTLNRVQIDADIAADVLSFTANASTPASAAGLANAWADSYIEWKRLEGRESTLAAVDSLTERISVLEQRRNRIEDPTSLEQVLVDNELSVLAASITELQVRSDLAASGTARFLQRAAEPNSPSNVPGTIIVALALFIGTVLGIAIALLRDTFADYFRTGAEVEETLGLPVLGQIPRLSKHSSPRELALETAEFSSSVLSVAYRAAQSSLEFHVATQGIKSILVTSANASEGKSTTAANLAWTHATAGYDTVLVDIDFHRPRIHAVYSLPSDPGLSDAIVGNSDPTDFLRYVGHPSERLRVLPAGSVERGGSDLIASPDCGTSLQKLGASIDLFILDSSPTLPVSDSSSLAPMVDAVVFVIKAEETRVSDVKEALDRLRKAGGNVIGVVLTNVRPGRYRGYEDYSYAAKDSSSPRRTVEQTQAGVRR